MNKIASAHNLRCDGEGSVWGKKMQAQIRWYIVLSWIVSVLVIGLLIFRGWQAALTLYVAFNLAFVAILVLGLALSAVKRPDV